MLLFAFGIWELLTQFASFNAAQSALKSTFLASAIRKCGGNEEKGNLLYTAYGSNGQVSSLSIQFSVGLIHLYLTYKRIWWSYWFNAYNFLCVCQQWGLFDRQFGRSDAPDADPEGRVPQWEKASVQELKDKFTAIGFGPRQVFCK